MLELAQQIPATMRFDPHGTYTFRAGPNAGRALKYLGPGERPFEDFVKVTPADGKPFAAPFGKVTQQTLAVCRPDDLVVK